MYKVVFKYGVLNEILIDKQCVIEINLSIAFQHVI